MIDWLTDTAWAVPPLSLVVAVVAVLATRAYGSRRPRLIIQTKVRSHGESSADPIQRMIEQGLTYVDIRILNSGSVDVSSAMFDAGRPIEFRLGHLVIDPRVTRLPAELDNSQENRLTVGPLLMKRGRMIRAQMWCWGDTPAIELPVVHHLVNVDVVKDAGVRDFRYWHRMGVPRRLRYATLVLLVTVGVLTLVLDGWPGSSS